jgi:cAMP-dependent protein kinase regulator
MTSSALISEDSGDTVIPLTHVRGERPSMADFAAEMVTRRRPKLSSHDLELLDLAPTDSAVTDPRPRLGGRQVEVETEAETAILDDDEPTTPPGHAPGDDFAERGATFERSFDETLAHLDPAGLTLEGPLGVFAMLPAEAAAELARRAVVKPYDPDEVVIREGDLGDACYIVVKGEVVVQKRGPDGVDLELARLGERALFGEFALLADRRRHATVVAAAESEIYEIPRLLLRELAAAFPAVGPALESFYRERLLSNLLLTTPLFALVPAEQRPALLARFQPLRVESGAAVVGQGERAGGLYLIVLGAVEVIRDLGLRTATVLASLGEGAYFGEMSLLSGDVASASVIAVGPCELAMLPPREFYEVVSGNPALWTAMRGEADARRLANAQILAGRTGVV